MMAFKFGVRSRRAMDGIHPDLKAVMMRAIQYSSIDFVVLEGLRTQARQQELYRKGATSTLNSRHLTGHAVDIAPVVGQEVRFDWPLYHKLAPQILECARILGVPLIWGGHWKKFPDGPHFELDRNVYK